MSTLTQGPRVPWRARLFILFLSQGQQVLDKEPKTNQDPASWVLLSQNWSHPVSESPSPATVTYTLPPTPAL